MLRPSLIAGIVLALALPLAAQQQDNSAPPPKNPPAQTTPPKKDPPKKNASQPDPFPESQSEAAAQAELQLRAQRPNSQNRALRQPFDQALHRAPLCSSGRFADPTIHHRSEPLPGGSIRKGRSRGAAAAGPKPVTDGAPPADNQSYSSSQVKGLDMPTTDETPPANLSPSPLPYDSKLARKDANIGNFYMDSGNWQGAYDRFLEAHRSDPGNAEAVFGLAESARHLHRDDEALRNYRLYLSALPRGPHAKEIHKVLKAMGAEP